MPDNKAKSNWFLGKSSSAVIVIVDNTANRLEYFYRVGIFPKYRMESNFKVQKLLRAGHPPNVFVKLAAKDKARNALSALFKDRVDYDVIMAYHTVVVIEDKLIRKPSCGYEALSTLKILSGHTHTVITGVALLDASNNCVMFDVATEVKFAAVSEEIVQEYVRRHLWIDTYAGYNIDKQGSIFVEKLNGSYYNVMGVPALEIVERLQKFLINYKKKTTTSRITERKSDLVITRKKLLPYWFDYCVHIVSLDNVTPSIELQDNVYDVPTGLATFPEAPLGKPHSSKYSDSLDWQ